MFLPRCLIFQPVSLMPFAKLFNWAAIHGTNNWFCRIDTRALKVRLDEVRLGQVRLGYMR